MLGRHRTLTLEHYGGGLHRLLEARAQLWVLELSRASPRLSAHGTIAIWMLFQAVLYRYLPGARSIGQCTPAGYLPIYTTNGLLVCIMSCLVYGALVAASRLKASSLTAHWGSFFVALNLRGLAATIIAYTKARLVPTQSNDQNRNGECVICPRILQLLTQERQQRYVHGH